MSEERIELSYEETISYIIDVMLLAVCAIDGEIKREELDRHKEEVSFIEGYDPARFEELYEEVKRLESDKEIIQWAAPALNYFSDNLSRQSQDILIFMAMKIAQADGVVHPMEHYFIKYLRDLRFSDELEI